MKVRKIGWLILMIVMMVLSYSRVEAATTKTIRVEKNSADVKVIPDRFNTGCGTGLRTVKFNEGDTALNGIVFSMSDATNMVIGYGKNKSVSGVYKYENLDFSNYTLTMYDMEQYTNEVTLTFKNCRFASVRFPAIGEGCKMKFEFQNCSFDFYMGSNATFEQCWFGGTYRDGMIPFQNVYVNNSYFSDYTSTDPAGKGFHTDGMQAYGYANVMVKNIFYDNCRFEVPPMQLANGAEINACIMVQLEYNNGDNIHFTNCIANGGSFCIYARPVKDAEYIKNISFEHVSVGNAERFGTVISGTPDNVVFDDFHATQNLYIGSVWKSSGKTHLSVTNDTGRIRKLRVITDQGNFDYTIEACPDGEVIFNSITSFSQLPIDKDIVIPYDCKYIVCYDMTYDGCEKQIRFENWSGQDVYVNVSDKEVNTSTSEIAVIKSGACGKNVNYKLYANGILKITGSGNMYDYYLTANPAPWFEYKDMIEEVIVEDGVTSLGSQAFIKLYVLSNVVLGNTVEKIEKRAFAQCSMLRDISLPASLTTISDYAFSGTLLQRAVYHGKESDLKTISIGSNNDELTQHLIVADKNDNESEPTNPITPPETPDISTKIIDSGVCGKEVNYVLYSDGRLVLSGTGATDYFYEGKRPGYFAYKDQITEVVVEKGITALGAQVFALLPSLKTAVLSEGLVTIDSFAFNHDSSLSVVYIPTSLEYVGTRAFAGTGITTVYYSGTVEQRQNMTILEYNETFVANLSIPKMDIRISSIVLERREFVYTGKAITPNIQVERNGCLLQEGLDYNVSYQNNTNPGTGMVIVTGVGNYSGELTADFTIIKLKQKIDNAQLILNDTEFIYTGLCIEPVVQVLVNGSILVVDRDYTVVYSNNVNPGTASVIVTGIGEYEGVKTTSFMIVEPVSEKPVQTISSGMCGKRVEYTLYDNGKMVLAGTGATYNFNSAYRPPFYEYRSMITEVIVEGSVTTLGQQLFTWFTSLEKVVLNEGVTDIEALAFSNTSRILQVEFPVSLKRIDSKAFYKSEIDAIFYAGSAKQWNEIVIGTGNDALYNSSIVTSN